MRFLTGQFALFSAFPTSNCSVGSSMKEVLFWKSPQRWLPRGPHVQDAWGVEPECHSLKSMIQQLYWTWWERKHVGTDSRGTSSHLSTVFSTSLTLALVFACRQTAPENSGFFVGFAHRRCLNHIQTLSCLSASVIKNSVCRKYYRNVSEGVMGVMFLLKFAV